MEKLKLLLPCPPSRTNDDAGGDAVTRPVRSSSQFPHPHFRESIGQKDVPASPIAAAKNKHDNLDILRFIIVDNVSTDHTQERANRKILSKGKSPPASTKGDPPES
jgi:hypothetical protein